MTQMSSAQHRPKRTLATEKEKQKKSDNQMLSFLVSLCGKLNSRARCDAVPLATHAHDVVAMHDEVDRKQTREA